MQNIIAQTSDVTGMPDPEIGMGVTEFGFSDRSPYTVVKILSPKKIVVQADDYKRVDKNGMSESQAYTYTMNPNGATRILTHRKNGWWIPQGSPMKDSTRFGLGSRDRYYDFTF